MDAVGPGASIGTGTNAERVVEEIEVTTDELVWGKDVIGVDAAADRRHRCAPADGDAPGHRLG